MDIPLRSLSLAGKAPASASSVGHAPVVVKCRYHRSSKRITFAPSALSFSLLRSKLEQSFSLFHSAYIIRYRDDENEISDISDDTDLAEALEYFSQGTDDSCATSSVVSFSSEGQIKVILPIFIELDYDGPSLSETASLHSYRESLRFSASQASLPSYIKSDFDALSSVESTRFNRRIIEQPIFTSFNVTIICGFIAAIQAPILFSLMDWEQFQDLVGIRFIHALFSWSILFYILGAIVAIVSRYSSRSASRRITQNGTHLPPPVSASSDDSRFKVLCRLICRRAAQAAEASPRIFTIAGTTCLLGAIMSLIWVSHPLTLHLVSMRTTLMTVFWIFLACLAYFIFDPST